MATDPMAAAAESAYANLPTDDEPTSAPEPAEGEAITASSFVGEGTVVLLRNPINGERQVFVARPTARQVRDYARDTEALDAFDRSVTGIVALTYLDTDQVEGLDARDFNTLANIVSVFMEGFDQ